MLSDCFDELRLSANRAWIASWGIPLGKEAGEAAKADAEQTKAEAERVAHLENELTAAEAAAIDGGLWPVRGRL